MPDYGACADFEAGRDPAFCVYCAHGEGCHPGTGPMHNGPLHPYPMAAKQQGPNRAARREVARAARALAER